MTYFELTISPNYASWSAWEAIREIIQNALDENDKGNRMAVHWSGGTLTIENEGSVLERRHLVLGESDKVDNSKARGQYGEGFKIALATLARLGYTVRIQTNGETWNPEIAFSEKYGTNLLRIKVAEAPTAKKVTYSIYDVPSNDYDTICSRILPLSGSYEKISTTSGDVLLDEKHKGRIYVKDIYVQSCGASTYGYNFKYLKLDRDRKMANHYDLLYEIRRCLDEAVLKGLDIRNIIDVLNDDGTLEAQSFSSYDSSDYFKKALSDALRERYTGAMLVESMADVRLAESFDKKPVIVGRAISRSIGLSRMLAELRQNRAHLVKRVVQPDEIDMDAWNKAMQVLSPIMDNRYKIRVVEFNDDKVLGSHSTENKTINVALSVCKRGVAEIVHTVVHELAHRVHEDHNAYFADEVGALFCALMRAHGCFYYKSTTN